MKKHFALIKAFLWSVFGNDDDPTPPEWHHPKWPQWARVLTWYVRNPLHNLLSYRWGLCGTANKMNRAYFPGHVWAQDGRKWQFSVWYSDGREYPFFSYRGAWVKCYLGWRPAKGGFGAALRFGRLKG